MTRFSRFHGRKTRVLELVAAAAASLVLTSCAGESELRAVLTGNVIEESTPSTPAGISGTVTVRKVRYSLSSVDGGLTQANTMLFVPAGAAPAGGWPVVAWAHGTTGVADGCAPSRDFAAGGDAPLVDALLRAGFAVVAPDYEGLDAPDVHPYYNRSSHAEAVLRAVQAASKVSGVSLSRRWAVMGHSQGGHVALSAAELVSQLPSEFDLRAVVAFAPGSDLPASSDAAFALIDGLVSAGDIERAATVQYFLNKNGAMVALGLEAGSGINPAGLIGARLSPLLEVARNDSTCTQFDNALLGDLQTYLRAGSDVRAYAGVRRDWYADPAVRKALDSNRIGLVSVSAPVLIVQGSDDIQVPASVTQALSAQMQANGTAVTRIDVPGADHNSIVRDYLPDAIAFIKARF
jgi:acetyl esterase/lipase